MKIKLAPVIFVLLLVGCGGEPIETVAVNGVVKMNGKPLSQVKVTFLPTIDSQNSFSAVGESDADGRFQLKSWRSKQLFSGAHVGDYRVTLEDLKPNDTRDVDTLVPARFRKRFPGKYASFKTTMLTAEITDSESVQINLDVER